MSEVYGLGFGRIPVLGKIPAVVVWKLGTLFQGLGSNLRLTSDKGRGETGLGGTKYVRGMIN